MIFGIPESFDIEVDLEPTLIPHKTEISLFSKLDTPKLKDLDILTQKFQNLVTIQNNEVERLIAIETERIRKKREEEERIRLEKEKQARLLEEKRKKEEAEALKKQEEERKSKEEAKRKAEEAEKEKQKLAKEKAEREKAEKLELERQAKLRQQKIDEENNKSLKIEKEFNKHKEKIKSIKTDIVEHVNANKELKKQIGVVRRKINPKFGQLSNSMTQLNKITNDIVEILNTIPPDAPYVLPFIFNFICKAIVSQAETEIVVQPKAALPLARLVSNLLERFPGLNEFLMPRLVKKCPIIIGYSCSIDTEEGRMKMGWKRNKSTNKWEESDKYDERVSGICSLFAVLTRLNNPYYPISMSWSMLARIANTDLKLIRNVHFFCVANWWESSGKFFVSVYKNQAVKLLTLLSMEMTNHFKSLPAATRLKILGEEGISLNMKTLKEMEN